MKVAKALVVFLMRLFAQLPLKVHYALSRAVAWFAEKILRYRRSEVTANLARSFPDKDYSELKRLSHGFYLHLGRIIAETVWFSGSNSRRLRRSGIVRFEGLDELGALYESSPGVMVLMSHEGNWELYGGFETYLGDNTLFDASNVVIVYLRQSSALWDSVMRTCRLGPMKDPASFEGYVEARNVLRYALERRSEKKVYNFIIDQYPYFPAKNHLHVNFMNQDTLTMKGAADLACKLGLAVCYLSVQEKEGGGYVYKYVPMCPDASALGSAAIMQRFYDLLASDLEAQPWNYLWSHRRWKVLNTSQVSQA